MNDCYICVVGYAPGFYTPSDLRTDYRRGLVMGITFCLFAMPMLSGSDADEVDAGRQPSDDVPGGLEVQLFFFFLGPL